MRETFTFFNENNKETIEIGVYFENDYSEEELDNFGKILKTKLRGGGWLIMADSFSTYNPHVVKRYTVGHVEKNKRISGDGITNETHICIRQSR